jgi:type IX secretion system PorP/SprF family membrane protein
MRLGSDFSKCFAAFLSAVTFLSIVNVSAQQTPLNPLSYWVFTPYLYNPAMVGSKDFVSLDLNAAFQGNSSAQVLSGNTRLAKSRAGYFTSPEMKEFKSVGIGGSLFHDVDGTSRNVGISGAGSYQIPLNTKDLSFLSFGASVKGIYNMLDTSLLGETHSTKNTFYPNVDAGIYYYGTTLYAGLSAINILGNPGKRDSTGKYEILSPRQYFLTLGYKFVLSRTQNIVLEPSVLIDATDSTLGDIVDNINPIVKLYIDNFCIGSYFLSDGNTSFFFEYRGPRFHGGAFFELPRKTAYYKKPPIVELTLGFNFQSDRSRLSRRTQW